MSKQLELEELPPGFALIAQAQLGQVLFLPPNVAGWDWGKAWINTNTLLTRYNVAGVVTKGSADPARTTEGMMKGTKKPALAGRLGRMMSRGFKGPDYDRIAPRPLREDPAKLVDALLSASSTARCPTTRATISQATRRRRRERFSPTRRWRSCAT